MIDVAALFPDTYEASRQRFRSQLERLRARWPQARLHSRALEADEDLTTDWFDAPPARATERLLIVTTGEHGIEGTIGAGILQLIVDEFLDRLNPQHTGLLLLHVINPWGMCNHRRTNAANVDLNRNFVRSPSGLDPTLNPDYAHLDRFLNPARPLQGLALARPGFLAGLGGHLMRMGPKTFQAVTLQGQYRNPRGLHFGGTTLQEETRLLMNLYRQVPAPYGHVLHLDMHTGYGPQDQMTLVNSSLEPRASPDLVRLFDYPRVAKATLAEFYPIRGDMIDHMYRMFDDEFPRTRLYATAFEFGTLGDSLPALLRGLRTMIWENQVHQFGTQDARLRQIVQREFQALFAPSNAHWRHKAIADARQALEGILRAEGFLPG
jgi:hypothetical protein